MRKIVLWTVAAATCVTLVHAQSLGQREMIAHDKIQVAEHAADTNKKCGTTISFTVDYSTFSDVTTSPDNPNQQSPWAFAANVTDAISSICGTDEGKAAVKSKIQKVVIVHAKTESETLANGTLHYAVPYNGAGTQTIITYLKGAL